MPKQLKINPPKFRPDKGQLKQMRELYETYMDIAHRNGISEQTVDNIVTGFVRRLFRSNFEKNFFKAELRKALAEKAKP